METRLPIQAILKYPVGEEDPMDQDPTISPPQMKKPKVLQTHAQAHKLHQTLQVNPHIPVTKTKCHQQQSGQNARI